MTDYEVGYGKPPKHSQFKKGVCANPRGRGKRNPLPLREIAARVMDGQFSFRERGEAKRASFRELNVKRLVAAALKGDLSAAAALLKLRARAETLHDGPMVVRIVGGPAYLRQGPLPERPVTRRNGDDEVWERP